MLLNRTQKRNKVNQSSDLRKSNTSPLNLNKRTMNNNSLNELAEYQLQLLNHKQSLVKDISHPRIRQLIINHHDIDKLLVPSSSKSQVRQSLKNNITNLQLIQQRKWLSKKGKKYLIDFDGNQRKQMKACFNAMDIKQSGSIGIDELEQLLISVGLMQSREEVKQLVDSVDEDRSGKVQFSQFLKMILNDQGQNQEIVEFFKFIINSNRKKNQQHIEWGKEGSLNKSRSKSSGSKSKKKISPATQQRDLVEDSTCQKSRLGDYRNKFYSSPEKLGQSSTVQKSSALNIFQRIPHPKTLPFGMIVSHIRRKHMMAALKIGQPQKSNPRIVDSVDSSLTNKSNYYISNNYLRSSQQMRESKASSNGAKLTCSDEDVSKGQNVMNALKKMWDRRLFKEIREKKSRKATTQKLTSPLSYKGKSSNAFLPNLQ